MRNFRVSNLEKELKKKNLDGILVSNPFNIFYLSGISFFEPTEREGFLLITTHKNYIITSSLYTEAVRKYSENFILLEITSENSLENILKDIQKKHRYKKIGFEEDSLTVKEFTRLKKIIPLLPSSGIVENLRQIKEENEIEKIKNACRVTDQAFKYILEQLKAGVTEIEVASLLLRFFESLGMTSSFRPIIAFGPNSSLPHHLSGKTKLKKNQIVLFDFGVKYDGYCSDFTRTVFFGTSDKKFKNMYSAVLEAQSKAFKFLKENKNPSLKEADKIARDHIISKGYPNIPHSLGHGIGIEVHDGLRLSPNSKDKLKKNMTFSLEPGIYIPGLGGVRIEDLVLYQKSPKFLTLSNRDLIEI